MYGDRDTYRLELFGSVLSAMAMAKRPLDIYVYSDREHPEFPLPIEVVVISPEKWARWTQNGKLTHLIKSQMMVELIEKLNQPVLYFDTDEIFRVPPEELFDKIDVETSILHAAEVALSENTTWTELLPRIVSGEIVVDGIDPALMTYNTGVMGMHPAHLPLLRKSVEMAHVVTTHSSVFDSEQVCTSMVFEANTRVITCEKEILHYWGWRRPFVHMQLQALRARWLSGHHELKSYRNAFRKMTRLDGIHWRDRLRSRISSLILRESADQRFAYLAYLTARRNATSHPRLGDAWLNTCLDSAEHQLKKASPSTRYRGEYEYLSRLDPALAQVLDTGTRARVGEVLEGWRSRRETPSIESAAGARGLR